jgi:hypothetical protein
MPRRDDVSFEEVTDLLEAWDPTFHSYTVAEERMQLYLDRALNPDPIEAPQRAEVRASPSQTDCDVVINDEIGINIYRKFTKQEFANFRRLLDDCPQDYVVMYAYDLGVEDSSRDQWRWTRSRYAGGLNDIEDIRFIHFVPGGEEPGRFDALFENPEAVLFGALSLVVGVALLVGSASGGESIVGGPVVTGLTSLVLVILLVLLWGISEG